MVEFLANVQLQKVDGSLKPAKEALSGKKLVALYFSAHWCPPCRQFTPVLKDFYEELEDDSFEIIFVSCDRSEKELLDYMKQSHGDWYFLPFGSEHVENLKKKYDVGGIPCLIVIKPNGDLVTKDGRAEVSAKSPAQVLSTWMSAV